MVGRSKKVFTRSGSVRLILLAATVLVGIGGAARCDAQGSPPRQQSVVAPDPFGATTPTALNGQISGHVDLNAGSFQAITLNGRDGVYFISGNGRYVLRGTLYDLWSGRELLSLGDIKTATETVNFGALAQMIPDFAPFRIGTGNLQEIVFVDPFCPYCKELLGQLSAAAKDGVHQFVVMPIALLGPDSVRVVRNLHCAQDREKAQQALLAHAFATPLAEDAGCSVEALQKRLIFARLLQIKAVPFLIRDDGRRHEGMPGNLMAWLAEARG